MRWITGSGCNSETELVSGSTDNTAIVWSLDKEKESYVHAVLAGHSSNVNVVDGVYKNAEKGSLVVVTVSVDSTVIIWCRPAFKGMFYY